MSPLPITWAEHVAAQGHWGRALREYMSDYVHWSCLGALCEFLALPENRVTLADEKDPLRPAGGHFSYSQCDNDKAAGCAAAQQVMEDMLHAAGADEVITIQRYAHLVGGARMAADEQHGVVDANNRSFAIPNLYITDGSPGWPEPLPRRPYLDRSWAVAVATSSTVLRCGFVHGPGLRR